MLAFSPFKLWWLPIVSLSLLLALYQRNNNRCAFRDGYFYGLGMFGLGTCWFFNSLHDFGQASLLAAAGLTLAAILGLSVFPALALSVWRSYFAGHSNAVCRVFAFAAVWVLFEWLRSWILTGFPWLLYGHALVDSPFKGIIPVLGVLGGSFFVAVMAAGLHAMMHTGVRQCMRWGASLAVVVFACWLLTAINWTRPGASQPVKVAAVQANIPFAMKWDQSRRDEVYQTYVNLTRRYARNDIVVWPETAIPTFYRVANENFIGRFETELKSTETHLLAGIFTHEAGSDRIFNSLVSLGGERQFYRKRRLVPFGEYLPLRRLFDFFSKIVIIPMSDLSSGEGSALLHLAGFAAGVSICYEVAFSREIMRALPQAEFLINVSNDAWFGNSLAPHQHLQIARARSLETGRYMLRATNTGISAVIDPQGVLLAQSGQFVDEVVEAEILPMRGSTPFVLWGNWAVIGVINALLLLILLHAFMHRRKTRKA